MREIDAYSELAQEAVGLLDDREQYETIPLALRARLKQEGEANPVLRAGREASPYQGQVARLRRAADIAAVVVHLVDTQADEAEGALTYPVPRGDLVGAVAAEKTMDLWDAIAGIDVCVLDHLLDEDYTTGTIKLAEGVRTQENVQDVA